MASENKSALAAARAERVAADYVRWLERQPLSVQTRRIYTSKVRAFLDWLASTGWEYGDPLVEPEARDYAARDFRSHLKSVDRRKPATVNLALAAIDSLYAHLGMEPPRVERERIPQRAPRALSPEEEKRFLRAVERCQSERDRALTLLLLHTGIRAAEARDLDVDDVALSARKGLVTVRSGKREDYREIPLNAEARGALSEWMRERKGPAQAGERAVFVSSAGARLTTRSIGAIVRRLAGDAGVDASPHVLRHTCLTKLVRGGTDLVLVADVAGHRRLDTTRLYTRPSEEDRAEAMEGLVREY